MYAEKYHSECIDIIEETQGWGKTEFLDVIYPPIHGEREKQLTLMISYHLYQDARWMLKKFIGFLLKIVPK